MVTIRDAAERDLPAILAITNDAIEHTTAMWTLTPQTLADRTAWMSNIRSMSRRRRAGAAWDA
jgi:phosphinothricin acetyltransferase